jgi:hypothetical protein
MEKKEEEMQLKTNGRGLENHDAGILFIRNLHQDIVLDSIPHSLLHFTAVHLVHKLIKGQWHQCWLALTRV